MSCILCILFYSVMKYQILIIEDIVFNAGIMIGSQNSALESIKVVGYELQPAWCNASLSSL